MLDLSRRIIDNDDIYLFLRTFKSPIISVSPNTPLDLSPTRQIRHDDVIYDGVIGPLFPLLPRVRYVTGMRQEADALNYISKMRVPVHRSDNAIYVPHRQTTLTFDIQV